MTFFIRCLVKNDDFNYLSQESDSKELDLDKQNGFYPYDYMSGFGKVKEEFSSKEKSDSLSTVN